MYKDNAKQKPNNIFPIFGSMKTGAKKLITENQKITDCHKVFGARATIEMLQITIRRLGQAARCDEHVKSC